MTVYTADPRVSNRDAVRFLIGDTDPANPLFSVGEIEYGLSVKSNNIKRAAAFLARQLAGTLPLRFSGYKLADYTDPDGSKMGDAYLALAKRLEAEAIAELGIAGIYAGGISESDKQTAESNTDRVQPAFARGMHDYDSSKVTE